MYQKRKHYVDQLGEDIFITNLTLEQSFLDPEIMNSGLRVFTEKEIYLCKKINKEKEKTFRLMFFLKKLMPKSEAVKVL